MPPRPAGCETRQPARLGCYQDTARVRGLSIADRKAKDALSRALQPFAVTLTLYRLTASCRASCRTDRPKVTRADLAWNRIWWLDEEGATISGSVRWRRWNPYAVVTGDRPPATERLGPCHRSPAPSEDTPHHSSSCAGQRRRRTGRNDIACTRSPDSLLPPPIRLLLSFRATRGITPPSITSRPVPILTSSQRPYWSTARDRVPVTLPGHAQMRRHPCADRPNAGPGRRMRRGERGFGRVIPRVARDGGMARNGGRGPFRTSSRGGQLHACADTESG